MAVVATNTILNRYFENEVSEPENTVFKYDVTQENGKKPSRINFSIERENVTLARGFQDIALGTYSFDTVNTRFPLDVISVQQAINLDVKEIIDLIEKENV